MIKIFLDDERHAPEGYIRTRTVETTNELIQWNDGNIAIVSLDNDLGEGFTEGYMVARFIESCAAIGSLSPIEILRCHSGNPVARNEMQIAFNNAQRFWRENRSFPPDPSIIPDHLKDEV